MKYYRLLWAEVIEDVVYVKDYDLKGFDLRRFLLGQTVDDWVNSMELFYREDGLALDYVPNVLNWLILSDKVVEIMRSLEIGPMQVFSIKLLRKDLAREPVSGYNIVNITERICAVDRERSDYVTYGQEWFPMGIAPNTIKYIRRIVLNGKTIQHQPDIFLLKEASVYFIVSECFKTAMESAGVTGMQFCPVEVAGSDTMH